MVKKLLLPLLLVIILWRIAFFVLGSIADSFFPYAPTFPYYESLLPSYGWPRWLYSWANFDGVHYLTIVEKGYLTTGLIQAFFPVYPLLITAFNLVFKNSLLSGLIISVLATIGWTLLWILVVTRLYSSKLAWISLAVILTFPTSFFFGALYTEAFFMLLVIGCLGAAHRGWWWLAGLLAAVASGTRVVGVFLVPALMVELLAQEWATFYPARRKLSHSVFFTCVSDILRHKWRELGWISIGAMGLLSYMFYLQRFFKDALYFLHVQSEFGSGRQENLVLFPQVVWRYIKILLTYRPIDWKYWAYVQEFIVGVAGLLGLLLSFKRVKLSWLVFSLGAFLLPPLTGNFSSMGRYVLVCLPLWIVIAQTIQTRRWLLIGYLVVSSLILVINTFLFIQGYWVA